MVLQPEEEKDNRGFNCNFQLTWRGGGFWRKKLHFSWRCTEKGQVAAGTGLDV